MRKSSPGSIDRWSMALLMGLTLAPHRVAAEEPPPEADELTTPIRAERGEGLRPLYFVLDLPRVVTEAALSPLYPLVYAADRWQLPARLLDLVTNDEKTLAVLPIVDFVSLRSGLGLGVLVAHNDPLGSPDRTIAFALVRTNGNREISGSFVRRMPKFNGRRVSFNVRYKVQKDMVYYGLGRDRERRTSRLIREDLFDASAGLTLFTPGFDWDAGLEFAYRFRYLRSGTGDQPGLVARDIIAAPQGFDKPLNYPEVAFYLSYDSRDAIARTTRGMTARVEVAGTHDLDRADTGGVRIAGRATGFIPLLPMNRVLVLSGGASVSFPTGDDDDIPLHHLTHLGGEDVLRSFDGSRHVDRIGWWLQLEYRYRVYEYAGSGNGLSAVVFFDMGNVARHPDEILKGPLPWSVGLALRVESSLLLLGRLQLAYGPEGFRFSLGIGELP